MTEIQPATDEQIDAWEKEILAIGADYGSHPPRMLRMIARVRAEQARPNAAKIDVRNYGARGSIFDQQPLAHSTTTEETRRQAIEECIAKVDDMGGRLDGMLERRLVIAALRALL